MIPPIDDITVIDRIFEEVKANARIHDVYVSTNEAFAGEFESYLADRPYEKSTLSVKETTHENKILGTVGALAQLVERYKLAKDTLVTADNNYISFDVGVHQSLQIPQKR